MPKSTVPRTNRLPRSNASSKIGKGRNFRADKLDTHSNKRTAETVKRIKMYNNGKAIRNKKGDIVGGSFMMKDRAGDREIDSATGRIQPDRRWFGNTRVVTSSQLDKFREEISEKISDPYSVILKRKKIPIGLLQDAASLQHNQAATNKTALLDQEPFEHVFGKNSRRKRVKLEQLLIPRGGHRDNDNTNEDETTNNNNDNLKTEVVNAGGKASIVKPMLNNNHDEDEDKNDDMNAYSALLKTATKSHETYEKTNTRKGIVPWGRDKDIEMKTGEGIDWHVEKKDDLFLKGQSKRIWAEFFKVIDCSDVILHIIDARNVPGTRCTMIERHISNHAKHKHLVYILNKVDLVPNWVAKRWLGELAKDRPAIAFHASMTHAFGKGALISLLRQFGTLHKDKKQISVGVIGYPNVGKSSVINTLISKKSCNVAPIPGETKIWQYITLFKRISLIDCPGVVVDTAGDTEEDSVLKGVVRSERLESPEDYVDAICSKVKREHIASQYKLPYKDNIEKNEVTWKDSVQLMEMIATKCGRLRKGGEPCTRSAAIMLINDYQRGRLPHYVPPPELKTIVSSNPAAAASSKTADDAPDAKKLPIKGVVQNLDGIGIDMKDDENHDEADEIGDAANDVVDNDADENMESAEEDDEDEGDKKPAALIGSGDWED